MTDDPVRDYIRYCRGQENQWYKENSEQHCEICGRPCARLRHYEFNDVVVCENCLAEAFRRVIVPSDVLDEMASEYEVQR